MSLELRQKVNDQFQRKKLEFYKMYNKNPQGNKHQHERGKKATKKVAYQVEGLNQDFQGMDDDPDVEEYEDDEYDDEDASPDTKSEKKAKKEEAKRRKQEEKEKKKEEKEKAK